MKAKTKLIEQGTRSGQYGIDWAWMIIDHPEHGRLLLLQGWGDSHGETYRWQHGLAVQLLPQDTFGKLEHEMINPGTTLLEYVTNGYDSARPALRWDGQIIHRVALSAMASPYMTAIGRKGGQARVPKGFASPAVHAKALATRRAKSTLDKAPANS